MIFLISSIFCSVFVGILFKIVKPNFKESFIMITMNYLTAIVLSYSFFDIKIINFDLRYDIIMPLVILMPTVFYLFNKSISKSGIIKTDIAQRISLLIPISASFLLFGETINLIKWIGIITGLFSIILILNKPDQNSNFDAKYLILVFLGYGTIDILFKQIALQNDQPYINYLFVIFLGSFFTSIIITFSTKVTSQIKLSTFIFGLILGILNFFNIYFYLKAHTLFNENPSTVFAIMNFGVISLASFIGLIFFKERLSKLNFLGVFGAFFSILLILISKYIF